MLSHQDARLKGLGLRATDFVLALEAVRFCSQNPLQVPALIPGNPRLARFTLRAVSRPHRRRLLEHGPALQFAGWIRDDAQRATRNHINGFLRTDESSFNRRRYRIRTWARQSSSTGLKLKRGFPKTMVSNHLSAKTYLP